MQQPVSKNLIGVFALLAKDTLANEDSPRLLSFAALHIAAIARVERLCAEHIAACLEAAGVALHATRIKDALNKAVEDECVTITRDESGTLVYKLMIKGEKEIEALLGSDGMQIALIEGGQPRTARRRLGDMLAELKGIVRICDPYYGVGTLTSLDHVPKGCEVRFLTWKTNESAQTVQRAIRDFRNERPNTEFRLPPNPSDLHDRYVLTDDSLFILGHGLKDIGGKESFMIRLDESLVPDLLHQLIQTFDARWQSGSPL